MSYISGFMVGTAIARALREMMDGGGSSGGSMGRGGQAVRLSGRALPRGQAFPAQPLALVASQPGRRRYRVSSGMSAALADLLEKNLARIDYISSASVNAATGSVLVCYDEAAAARLDSLMAALQDRVLAPASRRPQGAGRAQGAPPLGDYASMPLEAHAGEITRSIRASVRDLSAWIKEHTCGWFDVSSLAALLFLLRGMRKMLLDHTSPSGTQMLWWGISLLRGWRTI